MGTLDEIVRRESLSALLKARETIRALHGINCRDSAEEDELWSLYQSSPEMKQINAATDNLQKPYTERVYCRACKTLHCFCSWRRCKKSQARTIPI